MKPKRPSKSKALQPAKTGFDGLLRELRELITESRRQVVRAVDVVQVRTRWGVGRHIVEFEQGGAARAEAEEKIAELPASPRDFVRDPVLLEFLGLPETGRLLESDLEQKLIDYLQSFLLELGKGFATSLRAAA